MTRLLTYYGDDFTGSTDVMEALASHGVATVLFTRLPTPEEFKPFEDYAVVGLAGTSRSQTPEWMNRNLPQAFEWLKSLDARFCQYKVCSTFDSSPETGSIGRAADIGRRVFAQDRVAMIVGVPQLRRFTFAGHLFAGFKDQVYRIDRHPVMSRHPVTPMHESDLVMHLAKQSSQPVTMIDVYDAATQRAAGEQLLTLPQSSLPFVVGSSGVNYALMSAMDKQRNNGFEPVPAVDRLLVVSGSVSPTTERQINVALSRGFVAVSADAFALAAPDNQGEIARVSSLADGVLRQGKSPLIFTASGPSTDQSATIDAIAGGRQRIAKSLGTIACQLIETHALRRVVFSGGDTSSHGLGQLDIAALTTRFPLPETPGSPLCTAHSTNPVFAGLEIAMKGGQLAGDDYFVKIRDGLSVS
jgi:3-oxoisoapionate kinase